MLYVNPYQDASLARTAPGRLDAMRERQAFEEFERVFLYQMIRQMRKTVPDSSLFGKSAQHEYFEEMMDDVLAGEMAKSGQFGVADLLEEQLRIQEMQKKLQPTGAYPRGIALNPEADRGMPLEPESAGKGLPLDRSPAGFPLERRTGIALNGKAGSG